MAASAEAIFSVSVPEDTKIAFDEARGISKVIPYVPQDPADASQFVLYGKPRSASKWLFINDALISMQWTDDLETGTVNGTATLDNRVQEGGAYDGKRLSQILGNGSVMGMFYVPPGLDLSVVERTGHGLIEVGVFVAWDITTSSQAFPTMTINFYDHMKYLIESKITVLFNAAGHKKPYSADEITRAVAKSQGVALGQIPKVPHNIPYYYADSKFPNVPSSLRVPHLRHPRRSLDCQRQQDRAQLPHLYGGRQAQHQGASQEGKGSRT